MTNQDIIQAAKAHGCPISWIHEAVVIYDVRERGVEFACHYAMSMQYIKDYNHATCMQEAAAGLNTWRGMHI